jgi:hypothetical protein
METVKISIPDSEAVNDFVNKTSSFSFDLNLGRGSRIVDAKSFLGVLFLGIGNVCDLSVPKEYMNLVEEKLGEYVVKSASKAS